MQFVIDGPPIAKMRARTVRRGNRTHSYDPQAIEKDLVSRELISQGCVQGLLVDPLHCRYRVEFEFHMPVPKSLSQSAQKLLLWTQFPAKKPDVDNLAKFYLDAANGVLWPDDEQIVQASILKLYSEKPKTIIRVYMEKQIELDEKSRQILSLFTPDEVNDLIKTLMPGVPAIDRNDKVASLRAVGVLSAVADSAGARLAKIAKKYPGKWRETQNELINQGIMK